MKQAIRDTYLNAALPHHNYGGDEILRLNASSSILVQFESAVGSLDELRFFIADAWIPGFDYDTLGTHFQVRFSVSLYSLSFDEGYGTERQPLISQSMVYASLSAYMPLEEREVVALVHLAPLKRRMLSIPLQGFIASGNTALIKVLDQSVLNLFSRQSRTAFIPYAISVASMAPPLYGDFVMDTRIEDRGILLQAWQRRIPVAVRSYPQQTLSYVDLSNVWFDVYVYDLITHEEHYYTSLLPAPVGSNWYYIDLSKINLKRTAFLRLKPYGSNNEIYVNLSNRYMRL